MALAVGSASDRGDSCRMSVKYEWGIGPRLASPMLHLGLSHSDAPSGRLALDAGPANGE